MQNFRVLTDHEHAWLAHQCMFGEKIVQVSIYQFLVIQIFHQVQIYTDTI